MGIGRFVLGDFWCTVWIIRLGGIRQQALQVQERSRVVNRESTNIANPCRKVRYHHRLAIRPGGKAALARTNPAEVAVRAYFRNFRECFSRSLHSGIGLSRGSMDQIRV